MTVPRLRAALRRRVLSRLDGADAEAGMTTAEYAVGTVAACGFAGVLFRVITGPDVFHALTAIVVKALQKSF